MGENNGYFDVDGWTSDQASIQRVFDYLKISRSGCEKTKLNYVRILRNFCISVEKKPDDITNMDADAIEHEILKYLKPFKGRTYNDYKYCLKTFFKLSKVLNINYPHRYIQSRGGPNKKRQYIPTLKEAWDMVEFAGSLKFMAIIAVLICTGIRSSTLRAIQYGVVQTDDPCFKKYTIKNELNSKKLIAVVIDTGMKKIVPTACKGNVPYYVFISDKAAEILRKYLSKRRKDHGAKIYDEEPLFPSDYNNLLSKERRMLPMSDVNLNKTVKKAARNAGIKEWKDVTPYSLRKVFKSILRNQPADSRLDKEDQEFFLGHLQGGSMEYYYDYKKVEEMREKATRIVYTPAENNGKNFIYKNVKDDEVPKYLENGWEIEMALSNSNLMRQRRMVNLKKIAFSSTMPQRLNISDQSDKSNSIEMNTKASVQKKLF